MSGKPRIFVAGTIALAVVFYSESAIGGQFNVSLALDYNAAEQAVALFRDQPANTEGLSQLRGSRIAASTTGLIANSMLVSGLLKSDLDSLKHHELLRDDVYQLETARTNVDAIAGLLEEMKKQSFSRRVTATVEQIFPTDAGINLTIPVYVVAFGHENVDAYVRRIVWHGDVPEFVGEREGELTIVVNLAGSTTYGSDLQERFVSLLGVVAHEVFHAAFAAYKDGSSAWKRYEAVHQTPFDDLIDLTQNEGIAYYLSLDQRGRGYLPRDWNSRISEAFASFNNNATELLSGTVSRGRASQLLRQANLSGYRQSYGAMTGMAMARAIDLQLGRAALIGTIASGPRDFFRKYISVSRDNGPFPQLIPAVDSAVGSDD